MANIAGEAYADKFNDFNTDGIFGNHNSSAAGVITSTSTTSRQIQFALKLLF